MLRCLNFSELEDLAESLRAWGGAQLQAVVGSADAMALRLYRQGESRWLWVELKTPLAVFAESCPPVKKQKKPFHLFIEAHLVGRTLTEVVCDWREGRVLHLYFDQEKEVGIELRLFPQAKNIIVHAGGKQVSALKVKELLPVEEKPEPRDKRTPQEILDSVLAKGKGSASPIDPTKEVVKKLEQALKKKKNAMEKLRQKMAEDAADVWRKAGEWLKTQGSLNELPDWAAPQVDERQSYSWNLQNCFIQAKKIDAKYGGREERLQALAKEIGELQTQIANPKLYKTPEPQKGSADLMKSAGVKGRRFQIEEGVRINMGRSAKDNLSLLRVAKAWHCWLHLRDFPGSHAVIELNKGQKPGRKLIEAASQWLIAESLGDKAVENEIYTVIWAECRHVKPIKGDRLGRVRYQNEHTFNIRFCPKS